MGGGVCGVCGVCVVCGCDRLCVYFSPSQPLTEM